MKLKVGDKVKVPVYDRINGSGQLYKRAEYVGTVVDITERFVVVDVGYYREAFRHDEPIEIRWNRK